MKTRYLTTLLAVCSLAASSLAQEADQHAEHQMHQQGQSPSADKASADKPTEYTCPMHPELRQDEPGQCRICQMQLVDAAQLGPETGPHNGQLHQVDGVELEVLVDAAGIRIFAYNEQGKPLSVREARGIAELSIEGKAKRYRYDLFPDGDGDDAALASMVDLSSIEGQNVEVRLQLYGVPEANGRLPRTTVNIAVEPTEAQRTAAAIAAQGICPVTKQPLGSMGEPLAVEVLGGTVYVCCAGCIPPLQQDPDAYLPLEPKLKFAPATADDQEAIAAQEVCPVMDTRLGSMGTPIKVTGLERDVFLCCQGCVKKFEAEPQKFLERVSQ